MIQKSNVLRNQIISFGVVLCLLVLGGVIASPMDAFAATAEEDICNSIGGTWSSGVCDTPGTDAESALETVVNVLSLVIGSVAVIMLIIGGFRFVTSGGDANATKNARNTIIYSIVGIIVVLLSQAIVKLVLNKV